MSDRIAVHGTDVEVQHVRTGESIAVRIHKRGYEVLRVYVAGAADEMHDWELEKVRSRATEFIVPIGRVKSGSVGGNTLHCSFCGKSQHEVRRLIAGPKVFICNECSELVADICKTS